MAHVPWFEQWPERLVFEREALDALGIRWEEDPKARERGVLRVRAWPLIEGEEVEIVAVFPDLYPFFRFSIQAPGLDLPRHQHRFGGGLCVIGRSTDQWRTTDTLAGFIEDRVPLTIRVARELDRDVVVDLEQAQGEPITDYYGHAQSPNSIMLYDGGWRIAPHEMDGELLIGLEPTNPPLLRGRVLEIRGSDGRILERAEPEIHRLYVGRTLFPWVRVAAPPRTDVPAVFWAEVAAQEARLNSQPWKGFGAKHRIRGAGVLFQEEIGYRQTGDGWLFAVQTGLVPKPQKTAEYAFVRSGRAGRSDLASRIPELSPMAGFAISVFGLGCLGSPSVVEFARCGTGSLRVLDCDVVEAGTTVRWALGLTAAGWNKAQVILDYVARNYPFTSIAGANRRLGIPRTDAEATSDAEIIDPLVEGASLIYDATAELGVQHYLANLARERRLPYVRVGATQGGWGGIVARIIPGQTGCYYCLQQALVKGDIIPPPFDPRGQVQPVGCADPTFTGANFDLINVAMAGVRLAASTLCGAIAGAYPATDWDVAVLSLRSDDGEVVPPTWKTYPLLRHPECPSCSGHYPDVDP